MHCSKCGSDWNTAKAVSQCPFCGYRFDTYKPEQDIQGVFAHILDTFGISILNEKNKLISLLADYAPMQSKERSLINNALSIGIAKTFLDYNEKGANEQQTAVLCVRRDLKDKLYLDDTAIDIIISCFVAGLRWQIDCETMPLQPQNDTMPETPSEQQETVVDNQSSPSSNTTEHTVVENLAHKIIAFSNPSISAGANCDEWATGVKLALDFAVKELSRQSQSISTLSDYERVISQQIKKKADRQVLLDSLSKVGDIDSIVVESGKTIETYFEIVEGYQFDRGWISPYMVTDAVYMETIFENPYILVTNEHISNIQSILPLLEQIVQTGRKLVIIAEQVGDEAISTLIINTLRGTFSSVAIKAPGFGDRRNAMLEDIAIVTGARFFSVGGKELMDAQLTDLGSASSVLSTREKTVVVKGNGQPNEIKSRISSIKSQIDATTSDYDREKLQERFAKLAGGVARIYIGVNTELEMQERKARMKEALLALKASVEDGILLDSFIKMKMLSDEILKLPNENDAQHVGISAVSELVKHLSDQSIYNQPFVDNYVTAEIKKTKTAMGFDITNEDAYDRMLTGRVVPLKVPKEVIERATDIAVEIMTNTVFKEGGVSYGR